MTVNDHLATMRERISKATEGPWELIGGGEYVTGASFLVAPDDGGVNAGDATFIAHARTDLPKLLDAVERVVELHSPIEASIKDGTEDVTVCGACGVIRGGFVYAGEWPCNTHAALTEALDS